MSKIFFHLKAVHVGEFWTISGEMEMLVHLISSLTNIWAKNIVKLEVDVPNGLLAYGFRNGKHGWAFVRTKPIILVCGLLRKAYPLHHFIYRYISQTPSSRWGSFFSFEVEAKLLEPSSLTVLNFVDWLDWLRGGTQRNENFLAHLSCVLPH